MNQALLSLSLDDTICATATPPGSSAIAVIRISGKNAFKASEHLFRPRNKKTILSEVPTHTIHLGDIVSKSEIIDEVLVSVFKGSQSYTGEDSVEISCHGSEYIRQKIMEALIGEGLRLAQPGEFTMRAFLNGKFDLSQAEAVADLISAPSKTSHDLAINQMRGNFSSKIKELRQQLLDFASLIELELDFSEEDVEFANRDQLKELVKLLKVELEELIRSFSLGNVIRKGIPVAIVGEPNVGKSTLLNAILNEERAIVSEIPGTTRDTIEDTIVINGVSFRFIDTAGLRESSDTIESIGIERTYEKINQAKIILYVFDVSESSMEEIETTLFDFREHINKMPNGLAGEKKFILIANKTDLLVESPKGFSSLVEMDCIFVSAKRKENINLIVDMLSTLVEDAKAVDNTLVSNTRHYEALLKSQQAVIDVENGFLSNISSDLIAIDIRKALHHLGEITGEITTEEMLGNIFSNFCIGK